MKEKDAIDRVENGKQKYMRMDEKINLMKDINYGYEVK